MNHVESVLSSIEATENQLAREDNRDARLRLLGELDELRDDLRHQIAIERGASEPLSVFRIERVAS